MEKIDELIVSGSMLGASEILHLINTKKMITNFGSNVEIQIQPEGFNLTVDKVFNFTSRGSIRRPESFTSFSESSSNINDFWLNDKCYHLPYGQYQILSSEIVNLPKNVHVITVPHHFFSRCGCFINNCSLNGNYKGKVVFTIFVGHQGVIIEKGVAVAQAHFFYVLGENTDYKKLIQTQVEVKK